jgi:hypothetical protein
MSKPLAPFLRVSLISIPDSSPQAYGGVEYSSRGFFGWKDSEDPLSLSGLQDVLVGLRFLSVAIGLLRSMQLRGSGGLEKIPLGSDPSLGSNRSAVRMRSRTWPLCESNLRAPCVAGVRLRGQLVL